MSQTCQKQPLLRGPDKLLFGLWGEQTQQRSVEVAVRATNPPTSGLG
jgi:hypothetical protein